MAYGAGVDLDTLMKAMRDKAKADETDLTYLGNIEIVPHLLLAEVVAKPMIFLVAVGSPADTIGESDVSQARRAEHRVQVIPGVFVASPYDEDVVIGAGDSIGIIPHTQNVLKFYAGNLLGLTGLDEQNRPKIEAEGDAYGTMEIEDEGWLVFSTLNYAARTVAYDDNTR